MNVSYIILKRVIRRFQIYNLFREIFKFRGDKSNNVFREILKCFGKTPPDHFILQNCVSYEYYNPLLHRRGNDFVFGMAIHLKR